MSSSLPGSSVHGIFQERILEWIAISFFRGSSWPKGSNRGLPHCRQILYCLSHQGVQLYSFHMLIRLYSKSFKLSLYIWTENFQMYKLGLEKAEEPEIKLPTFVGSWRKQENSRKKTYFCFINYDKAFECVYHNKLWKILRDGRSRPPYLSPETPVWGSRSNS